MIAVKRGRSRQDDELFDGPPDVYGCKAALMRLDRDDGDILLFSSPTLI